MPSVVALQLVRPKHAAAVAASPPHWAVVPRQFPVGDGPRGAQYGAFSTDEKRRTPFGSW